jgi:3-phenylpropionate/trans-cinnamate dioxygenase ferredoxin reductase subunit
MSGHLLVVGGSMAGLRTAEQVRKEGFTGRITVVSQERHMPYNRPPLSKEVLARHGSDATPEEWHSSVAFRLRASVADVEWRLGVTATASDLAARTVTLDDGLEIRYDGLVAATGLRPRRLPIPGPPAGRHVIRTLDDAVGLRAALRPEAHVVIVGAGFIGCEVAATARTLGCEVDVVEPTSAPMVRPLGVPLGSALQRHHEQRGVRFHLGRTVAFTTGPTGADDATRALAGVVLDDGTQLPADVLVESVGSHANTEWLAGNGLDLVDGLLCDNWLRVEGRTDLVAVGDIARFPNPSVDSTPRRVEHWCIPTDTAKRAARTITAHLEGRELDTDVFAPLPSFWSDQFELRLQGYGAPGLGDNTEMLEGSLDGATEGQPTAVGYLRGEHVVGVVLIGVPPAHHQQYRGLVGTARVSA